MNLEQVYEKLPIPVKATQWFKNGDHPADYDNNVHGLEGGEPRTWSGMEAKELGWEGQVVRYYRNPIGDGNEFCQYCKNVMHVHGWIETLEGGHIVCPGDWVITGIKGERYPCKPDIFAATYKQKPSEPVVSAGVEAPKLHPGETENYRWEAEQYAKAEASVRPEQPKGAPDEGPKVLTAECIKNLVKDNHKCTKDSCGCECGRSYNKRWEPIISRRGRFAPDCKCKPNGVEAASPQSAQGEPRTRRMASEVADKLAEAGFHRDCGNSDPLAIAHELETMEEFVELAAYSKQSAAPTESLRVVAEKIVNRLTEFGVRLAIGRHDLIPYDDDQMSTRNEQEIVDDVQSVALGNDTGCLDPAELSAENCEIMFVEAELQKLAAQPAGQGVEAAAKEYEEYRQSNWDWNLPEWRNLDSWQKQPWLARHLKVDGAPDGWPLSLFCERHTETTLADANVSDPCPLCSLEKRLEAEAGAPRTQPVPLCPECKSPNISFAFGLSGVRTTCSHGHRGNLFRARDMAQFFSTPQPRNWILVERVIAAARCIRHWHDTLYNPKTNKTEGMVVSAEHVRLLWQALADYDKDSESTPQPPKESQ